MVESKHICKYCRRVYQNYEYAVGCEKSHAKKIVNINGEDKETLLIGDKIIVEEYYHGYGIYGIHVMKINSVLQIGDDIIVHTTVAPCRDMYFCIPDVQIKIKDSIPEENEKYIIDDSAYIRYDRIKKIMYDRSKDSLTVIGEATPCTKTHYYRCGCVTYILVINSKNNTRYMTHTMDVRYIR